LLRVKLRQPNPSTEIGVVDSSSMSVELSGVFGESISLDLSELRVISEATLLRLFG
jgi:hypothetical protein